MSEKLTRDKRLRQVLEGDPDEVLATFDFMAAGVGYEGRHRATKKCEEGDLVILRREPDNEYDRNAIELYGAQGRKIGYVPREEAQELAPYLDGGARHQARITRMLTQGRYPIPVVWVDLYSPETSPEIAISQREVLQLSRGCGIPVFLLIPLLLLGALILFSWLF